MLEFEVVTKYQLLPISSDEQQKNKDSIIALTNSERNGILTRQDEGTVFTYLNQTRDRQNPNNFLPTDKNKPPHLFFLSEKYGTLEFEIIDSQKPMTPVSLELILSNLNINSETNYPENSQYNVRLLSRRRNVKEPNLNVIILNLKTPVNPHIPEPIPDQPPKSPEPTSDQSPPPETPPQREIMDTKEQAKFFASKISDFYIPLDYENGRGTATGGNVESSKNFDSIWPYDLNNIIPMEKLLDANKNNTDIFIIPNKNTPNSTCFYINYTYDNPHYEGELMTKSAQIIINDPSNEFQTAIQNNPNLLFETLKEKIGKPIINYSKNRPIKIKTDNPIKIYNYSNQP